RSLPPGHVRLILGRDFAKVYTPSASDLPAAPSPSTTALPAGVSTTTTTLPIGWTPGVPPPGVTCR
ncbi:MAG: hypothetical protein ACKOYM_03055, partial [Actinomycetes bacterium]